jgi:hypothetical protein
MAKAIKKMPRRKGTFEKGARRFTKLQEKVHAAVPPGETVRWWFIGNNLSTRGARPLEVAFSRELAMLFSKEAAFAVTDRAVHVIPMSGPGVFSATIVVDQIQTTPLGEISVTFDPDEASVSVGELVTHIYPAHEFDAVQFAHACGAQMPDWFQAA